MEEHNFSGTKCPLCSQDCRESRMLPCLHSFCFECLKGHCKDALPSETAQCPACATLFALPIGGVSDLPQNFIIDGLLRLTNCLHCNLMSTDPRTLPCVHTFCLQCIKFLFPNSNPGDHAKCPACPSEFSVPEGGLSCLPKNFMVEKLTLIREAEIVFIEKDVHHSLNGTLGDVMLGDLLNDETSNSCSVFSSDTSLKSVDIFQAIKPLYATFVDVVDPVQMVDLLIEHLTKQDMDLIHVKTRNEGRAAGNRALLDVMNGRVPVVTLVNVLHKLKLQDLADSISRNEAERMKLTSIQQSVSLRYPVPTYVDQLADICMQRRLPPPEVKSIPQGAEGHMVEISVRFEFRAGKECPSKKEAEESAAEAAIGVLLAGNSGTKSKKVCLHELCQKEPKKYGKPVYKTYPDKVGPYYSVIHLNIFGVSNKCQSEKDAKDIAARDVLNKLNLVPHLSRLVDDGRFTETEFHIEGEAGKYQASLSTRFLFEPDRSQCAGYEKSKDAEKHAARRVLLLLYPDDDVSDIDKCKNKLQEKNPFKLPSYSEVKVNDKYLSRVNVHFRTTDDTSQHEHVYQAKDSVVRETFRRLGIDQVDR